MLSPMALRGVLSFWFTLLWLGTAVGQPAPAVTCKLEIQGSGEGMEASMVCTGGRLSAAFNQTLLGSSVDGIDQGGCPDIVSSIFSQYRCLITFCNETVVIFEQPAVRGVRRDQDLTPDDPGNAILCASENASVTINRGNFAHNSAIAVAAGHNASVSVVDGTYTNNTARATASVASCMLRTTSP